MEPVERALTYEEEILAKHSTPGLRKHELTRQGKKEQLDDQGMHKFPADRDKILDQLYGVKEPVECPPSINTPPTNTSSSS
jgi:hypothetical protein